MDGKLSITEDDRAGQLKSTEPCHISGRGALTKAGPKRIQQSGCPPRFPTEDNDANFLHLSGGIGPDVIFGDASDIPQGSHSLNSPSESRLIPVEKKRGFGRGISL